MHEPPCFRCGALLLGVSFTFLISFFLMSLTSAQCPAPAAPQHRVSGSYLEILDVSHTLPSTVHAVLSTFDVGRMRHQPTNISFCVRKIIIQKWRWSLQSDPSQATLSPAFFQFILSLISIHLYICRQSHIQHNTSPDPIKSTRGPLSV